MDGDVCEESGYGDIDDGEKLIDQAATGHLNIDRPKKESGGCHARTAGHPKVTRENINSRDNHRVAVALRRVLAHWSEVGAHPWVEIRTAVGLDAVV